jgi:N-acetylglucosaminyl-diphospho-decaprenol L-rhamnosyltransferase
MDVGIILVNYKTAQLAIDCLNSLAGENPGRNFQVAVVDNDSQDGSFETINAAVTRNGWDSWVKVIAAERNGGFSYGNNVGIRHFLAFESPPKYFHLLNSDTVVHPGAIQALIDFMDAHPKAGVAGSRLEDDQGQPYHASFQFHTILSELERGFSLGLLTKLLKPWVKGYWHPAVAEPCDWVAGASMIIRREVFDDIGLMDEAYFLYYEETDFCLLAKRAGWECWHVPESRVIHFEGSTTGVNSAGKKAKRRPTYWFDSRRRYFVKNYGGFYAALADLAWIVGFANWQLRNLVQKKPDEHPEHFLRDSIANSVFVRGFNILPVQNK